VGRDDLRAHLRESDRPQVRSRRCLDAGCSGSQVPACGTRVGLVTGVPRPRERRDHHDLHPRGEGTAHPGAKSPRHTAHTHERVRGSPRG
jgi:hypothetical protein